MFQIILAVMGIVLLSSATALTVSYIPAHALQRQAIHQDADQGMRRLQYATARFLEHQRDGEGVVISPGHNVDIAPLVVPRFGFWPANVRNAYTWEARTGEHLGLPAVYLCLKPLGAVRDEGTQALSRLRDREPLNSAFMADGCGATSDAVEGATLTVWMIMSHFDGPPPAPVTGDPGGDILVPGE